MQVIETIKRHPYLTGAGVFFVGIVIVLAMAGGKSEDAPVSVAAYGDPNSAAYGAQVAVATLSAQVQSRALDAQQSIAFDNNATLLAKSRIELEALNNANVLTAGVQTHALDIDLAKTQVVAKRDTEIAGINANAAIAINAANNATTQAAILSDERVKYAAISTEYAKIYSDERIAAADYNYKTNKLITDYNYDTNKLQSDERIAGATLLNTSFNLNASLATAERMAGIGQNLSVTATGQGFALQSG